MADALVSVVLGQLTSIVAGDLSDELKLLKGVEKEIQKLITDFESITAVLDDAEKRSLKEETRVQKWVDQLKDICYDMEDVLDEWRTETVLQQQRQPVNCASWLIEQVIPWISSLLPCIRRLVWKHNIALRIKDINQRLDVIVNEKDRFNFTTGTTANKPEKLQTTSFFDEKEICGRGHVKKSLIDRLLGKSSREEQNLTITAIVGMPGIGKTALAQLAYNDENVKKHFHKQIWVCVSNPFKATNIARAIIEGLKGRTSDLTELQSMLQEISEAIKNQKFLLILDDVWNEDYEWEPLKNCLKNGAKGSKILVTSRSVRVANIMKATYTIRLGQLLAEDCWSIFRQRAFFERREEECKELEEIGRKISERCKGLPLAAKVLGGLMCFKRSQVEWQNVLDSDLWALEGANKELDPVFMLSYRDLPSPIQSCFKYCATFPEDHSFFRDDLIQQWMANGFLEGTEMETTGEEYFESLAKHSLFQDFRRNVHSRIFQFKMHDLVRDFALRVSRNECGAIEVYKDKEELMMKQEQQPGYAKLRHVRLTFEGERSSSALSENRIARNRIGGLRTLVITKLAERDAEMLGGLICCLSTLRALEVRSSDIKELPEAIGKLMHLRYLGLVFNRYLEALPETVCDLFNLQTLKLTGSYSIKTLPRGIGKLVNLRHLEHDDTIKKLPKRIVELTCLRKLTIESFSPRSNNNNEKGDDIDNDKEECFGIGDLEKLNRLENLTLQEGWNVELSDDVVGEARRAGLKNKRNLRALGLMFDRFSDAAEGERAKWRSLIAEAFEEPPPNLEELYISFYDGTELPGWIASLSQLKFLSLRWCPNLREFPGDLFKGLPQLLVEIQWCPQLSQFITYSFRGCPQLPPVYRIFIEDGKLVKLAIIM